MTSAPSWSHRQHGLTGTGEMQLPGAHVPGQGLLQRKILVLKSVIRRKCSGVSVALEVPDAVVPLADVLDFHI